MIGKGNFSGAGRQLGNIWASALQSPDFWLTIAVSATVANLSIPKSQVSRIGRELKGWLGRDYRKIINKSGDMVFLSKKGDRRIRFDLNNPSPHKNPHMHIEELKSNGKWTGKRIYPKDIASE